MNKKKVSFQSPTISDEQIQALRTLMPHIFTEGKIDFEKLHAALGDFADERPERYSFSWGNPPVK